MNWLKRLISLLFLFGAPLFMAGQELVYEPVNPAFGGDTFNYQWLLSSAEAQNIHEEDNGFSFDEQSEIDSFSESLNRQLLNKISSDLFREQFGEGEIQPGTYMFGSLVLEISPSTEGLLINILDTQTGDQTQIIIPN
ncbi:MAG: curli assembly protein CsgF [Flavobacteriaceae bacterium]|uniref:curli production assembly/transport component CsgF n=1 Tax=Lutimonas saemankumensis TaxID=483016 RepID=UPI001CD7D49F|nr:curli production assembly/transport component CsgF [Lutimonas saemankumensis]MCA0931258.1 curli assembly protein CsgF [Lutimonas saemankumensis]UCE92916.1 MAG: curli assembly protein CsgF [Flavobacteriaceae bacterium]